MGDLQDVKGSDDWYRDCEKVGITLHHCVMSTETPTNKLRKGPGQMKKIADAHDNPEITGDRDSKI